MTKEVVIGLTTVLLVATPVFAAPGNGNGGKSDEAKNNHGQEKKAEVLGEQTTPLEVTVTEDPTLTPTLTITVNPTITQSPLKLNKGQLKKAVQGVTTQAVEGCDPNAEWKNHGAYVSCVAKTHPGGEVVSAAARSDVGKKQKNPTLTPSVSPTSTPSATPSVSPSPVTSPEGEITLAESPFETFVNAISRLIKSLPFLNKHS